MPVQLHHHRRRHLDQRHFADRQPPGRPRRDHLAGPKYGSLRDAVLAVSIELAQAIVRDGEGATKFIAVQVDGGRTEEECRLAAYAVGPFAAGEDSVLRLRPQPGPHPGGGGLRWHRDLDQPLIDLHLDDVRGHREGGRHPPTEEADGQRVMKQARSPSA